MDSEKTEAQKLIDNIRIELTLCDPLETPYICANIDSQEGYDKIEKLIVSKILQNKLTINEAIVQIENELNPNSITGHVE